MVMSHGETVEVVVPQRLEQLAVPPVGLPLERSGVGGGVGERLPDPPGRLLHERQASRAVVGVADVEAELRRRGAPSDVLPPYVAPKRRFNPSWRDRSFPSKASEAELERPVPSQRSK